MTFLTVKDYIAEPILENHRSAAISHGYSKITKAQCRMLR